MFRVQNLTDRKLVANLNSGLSIRLPAKGAGKPPVEIFDEDRESPELKAMETAQPRPLIVITQIAD